MTEQIYIDGMLMELDSSRVNVQLIYQSPVLVDFQQIVSNRTTQVSLPATTHNLRAIGYTGTQVVSDFAYRYHTVIYKRDGLQLLKGNATLLSIGKGSITMCFTWGNVTVMKALFDLKLRDLEDTPYCAYPPTGRADDAYKNMLNFGGSRQGVSLNIGTLLTAIETQCGVSGLSTLEYQQGSSVDGYGFAIAMPGRNGNLTTRYLQGLKFGAVSARTITTGTSGQPYGYTLMTKGADSTDPHSYMDSDGYIDVQDKNELRVHLKGYFTMTKRVTSDVEHKMQLIGTDGVNWTLIDTFCEGQIISSGSNTYVIRYVFDVDDTYDVSAYNYVAIVLFHDVLDYQPESMTDQSLSNRYIVPEPNEPEEVMYGTGIAGAYPIFKNLPDITCGQLIKNLLWLRGEFAYTKDGRTFSFISLNQLQANKADAIDWTTQIKGEVQEMKTTLDNTAQRNMFLYAEADWYDNTQYGGTLPTDDETIDAEVEYCKSDFALVPEQSLPAWTQDADEEWQFEGDGMPNIMLLARYILGLPSQPGYYDIQRFQNLLKTYYQQYAEIILRPVQIKATVILTTLDLYTLDLTVPVYLQQTGHYYLIRKLLVKGSADCEVELIKI